jgi:UDP-glucose 4-epimerase
VRADLRTADDLGAAFEGVDVLIHLAAVTTGGEADQFANTVTSTERLLEAMAETATRRVVLASSFTVYDWQAACRVLTEATPLTAAPYRRGAYTVAKVWQERVARRICAERGLDLTVLRPGVVWGAGNRYPPGITVRLRRVHVVVGVGARIPLTYVENCADCFVTVAEKDAAIGETFNVVDGPGVSTSGYVAEYLRRTAETGARVVVPYAIALAGVRAVRVVNEALLEGRARLPSVLDEPRFVARFRPLVFSNEKLRRTGWQPPISYEEALARAFPGTSGRPTRRK